jgi:hypothetical protein
LLKGETPFAVPVRIGNNMKHLFLAIHTDPSDAGQSGKNRL